MSMAPYGARSICEYPLAPASRSEIRLLASRISFISCSVSMVYFSQPMALGSSNVAPASSAVAETRSQPVDVQTGFYERRGVIPRVGDAVILEPVADLILTIGSLQCGELQR